MGFSDPGGADTSAPFTPATPGPGGGRGFLLAPSGESRFTAVVVEPYGIPTTDSIPLNTRVGFSGEMKQDQPIPPLTQKAEWKNSDPQNPAG